MKYWPDGTSDLVRSLNEKLKIDHYKWHKLKGNKNVRAAELISTGLCQLIIGNNDKEAIAYLEESLRWLKGINIDKPCPDKKSSS